MRNNIEYGIPVYIQVEQGADGEKPTSSKTLDQEPLLAARIMIEDAMCLLLDVEDIDRLLYSQSNLESPQALHQRRTLLLEGAK